MRIVPPPLAIHLAALAWTGSWRIAYHGEDRVERARAMTASGAMLAVFWHQSLLMAGAAHHHRGVAALISRSTDGGMLAAHLSRVGIGLVRGSSSSGAAQAAREVMRAVDQGRIIATGCDGPRGPRMRPKPGFVEIARRHRVPLLPLGFGASRSWEVPRAWDRLRIPWPGARISVVYGEPVLYPPEDPDPAELARRCDAVAAAINALEREAMALAGVRRAAAPG